MMETRKAGTERRRKVVPPESNESGIEESNIALWLDWNGLDGAGIGLASVV